MSDDRVFYGPHPCKACGKTITKASHHQGGEEFDYPDGPIYPNTEWRRHDCDRSIEQVVNPSMAWGAGLPE